MLDIVEPVGPSDNAHNRPLKVCPKCETAFEPKRSNQKYCTKSCAKAATRNTARGNRKTENSKMNKQHAGLAWGLRKWLYSTAPDKRLGVMKIILDGAVLTKRSELPPELVLIPTSRKLIKATPASIRRVLTDPRLLRSTPEDDQRTVSQAASAYTQKFFGVSIQVYLEQARKGTINENHPVAPRVDYGQVPRLRQIKKVKCWHKPLSRTQKEEAERRHAEDMRRVSAIVAKSQADVAAHLDDQTKLAANF